MFGQVQPTPYDLYFTLFGIPVRVHPGFWLFGCFFGWNAATAWAGMIGTNILAVLLVWLACMFLSILTHEMGHALVVQRFGWGPHVVLYHIGGYAAYQPTRDHTPKKSIAISLAGPGAGFVLYGIVRGIEYWLIQSRLFPVGVRVFDGSPALMPNFVAYAIDSLLFMNLWWGLLNLIPVLPLDGGRVCEQAIIQFGVKNGQKLCLQIGVLASGGVGLFFLMNHQTFAGLMFAFLCINNIQTLQSMNYRRW